ncbi:hypothetical protein WICPIJ_009560 [Wickerhamomyces pijperi]|uniref:Knr4/Smi1-like domain-containing protein n=1 Tax=Wickerhamomyces pijperi TaxID=599730 RepID=A0A9P8PM23_WICPI|nr:hypothetical protein WICPIJ_009560 [Wickerhamomyces pijperi]
MGIKDVFNQFIYGLTTEDRYAEYDHNAYAQDTNNNTAHLTSQNNSRSNSIQMNDTSNIAADQSQGENEGVSEAILAWRHIDDWTNANHSDLHASLADPCTKQDLFKAEQDLQVNFPPSVRASLRIHDGQEDLDSLQGAGGLIYGLQLMSLSEIVEMTKTWRLVSEKLQADLHDKQIKDKLFSPHASSSEINLSMHHSNLTSDQLVEARPGAISGGSGSADDVSTQELAKKMSLANGGRKLNVNNPDLIPRQQSIPPQCVRAQYCDWNWIPLVTDNSGNHIAIDLNPDVKGTYGQVILFGRDYDTKFVIAKNWGDFLLSFTNDLGQGNFYFDVEEEEDDFYGGDGQLLFKDKRTGRELPYLTVLTTRTITKLRAGQPLPQRQQQQHRSTPVSSQDRSKTNLSNVTQAQAQAQAPADVELVHVEDDEDEVKTVEPVAQEEEEEEEKTEEVIEPAETTETTTSTTEASVDATVTDAAAAEEEELSNDFKEIAL